MDVSENSGYHPILIGFSSINHPFWDATIFGNTHMLSLGETKGVVREYVHDNLKEASLEPCELHIRCEVR